MNGIYHKIGIRADEQKVAEALTTKQGLSSWWTREVEGDFQNGQSMAGERIRFKFGPGQFEMKVLDAGLDGVHWECVDGPEDWVGSHVDFDLKNGQSPDGESMTLIHFRHRDWKNESDFTAHCSMKWAIFLLSLRDLVEKGKGQPAPDDVKIDDMN
ncbi:MAG: SRPBCC domain-containing protein [Leptospiraceae bacterium]